MATNYRIGQSVGSQLAVRALSTVIDQTLPYALEDVTRDLERARMQTEDIRARAHVYERGEMVSWRDVAWRSERNLLHLWEIIDDAHWAVESAMTRTSRPSSRWLRDLYASLDPRQLNRRIIDSATDSE